MERRSPVWPGWRARWYLWEGGFFALGRSSGPVPLHSHHAIQVCLALDGQLSVREEGGTWQTSGAAVVPSDVAHCFDGRGSVVGMIFIDPESRRGRWLNRSLEGRIVEVSGSRLDGALALLEREWNDPSDEAGVARVVDQVVRGLCVGPAPRGELDPRIARSLARIRDMDVLKVSLDAAARAEFLSPSRFAHLFKEEVGLPFRRYLLWRKLTRAMLGVGRGMNLSEAAHASGFADSAHLTRTCRQMLGVAPSTLMAPGEFWEIPDPFQGGGAVED